MIIKTEFDLNEIVYYLHCDKIHCSRIETIETQQTFDGLISFPVNIVYTVMDTEGNRIKLIQGQVFKTVDQVYTFLEHEIINLSDCRYSRY
jgi:hypothetical protein